MDQEFVVLAPTEQATVIRAHGNTMDEALVFGGHFSWCFDRFALNSFFCRPKKHSAVATTRSEKGTIVGELHGIDWSPSVAVSTNIATLHCLWRSEYLRWKLVKVVADVF